MSIKVKDNFLPKKANEEMFNTLTNNEFPWYYISSVTRNGDHPHGGDKDKNIYFTHVIYNNDKINSTFYEKFITLFFKKLKIKKLIRAKLNLYVPGQKIIKHKWHVDYDFKHKTALYYLNTNNGCTTFKDPNKKISSVANRCAIFDGHHQHRSSNCTDQKCRITLNVNYE
tara:strand:+ start:282 stop:791 length:510 start_codon:yes stop_codon:yes gene_type:complete